MLLLFPGAPGTSFLPGRPWHIPLCWQGHQGYGHERLREEGKGKVLPHSSPYRGKCPNRAHSMAALTVEAAEAQLLQPHQGVMAPWELIVPTSSNL